MGRDASACSLHEKGRRGGLLMSKVGRQQNVKLGREDIPQECEESESGRGLTPKCVRKATPASTGRATGCRTWWPFARGLSTVGLNRRGCQNAQSILRECPTARLFRRRGCSQPAHHDSARACRSSSCEHPCAQAALGSSECRTRPQAGGWQRSAVRCGR
jgi:hypothetical protein